MHLIRWELCARIRQLLNDQAGTQITPVDNLSLGSCLDLRYHHASKDMNY